MERAIFVRSAYNYDVDAVSEATGLACEDDSMTQQQFKEEVDINTLVNRFGLAGEMPEGVRTPTYGDFSEVYDFHSAMNAVAAAKESFDAMPWQVRERFGNDAAAFVAFCSEDKNREEARAMGLLDPERVDFVDVAPRSGASGAPESPSGASVGGEGASAPKGGTGGA